jgi:lysozyme family protein
MKFEDASRGYGNMWRAAEIRPARRAAALALAKRALANRARYEAAAAACPGMPWWWVACAHSLESGMSWTRHLHNGDPLTARTVHVPAGRPAAGRPPFTWEASARDALTMPPHSLHRVPAWTIERALYELERYNGFGYVKKRVNSPYLWSFTTLYASGKYVADGRYDPAAVSQQCGAVAIMKALDELGALTIGDRSMTELASAIQPFAGLVPNLVRAIAGPLPSIAVRALAEALGTPPGAGDVQAKLEAAPISELVGFLQRAEELVQMISPPEPVAPPVRAEEPEPAVTAAPSVAAAPAASVGPLVVQPVQPEPGTLDKLTGGWLTGWKTYAGIAVYVAGHVAGSLGYIDASTAEAIATAGAGLAGVGVIAKIERWLPLFAGFLRVRRLLT